MHPRRQPRLRTPATPVPADGEQIGERAALDDDRPARTFQDCTPWSVRVVMMPQGRHSRSTECDHAAEVPHSGQTSRQADPTGDRRTDGGIRLDGGMRLDARDNDGATGE
jgi:hypothetical protein